MSENKRDYQVGRGEPPVQSRFKNGQSGDPRGRITGPSDRHARRAGWS